MLDFELYRLYNGVWARDLMPCLCRVFCRDFCDFHKSLPCFLPFFAVIFYCSYTYCIAHSRCVWASTHITWRAAIGPGSATLSGLTKTRRQINQYLSRHVDAAIINGQCLFSGDLERVNWPTRGLVMRRCVPGWPVIRPTLSFAVLHPSTRRD